MGADSVAGVIIDLSISGGAQVADASNRVQAKLRDVERGATASSQAAANSVGATDKASQALESFDTRLEISYTRLRRTIAVLERLAKKAAQALGDEELADEIGVTTGATRDALENARLAFRVGSLGGPEVAIPLAAAVGIGTFAYEEITGLNGINERNAENARRIAQEEIAKREREAHDNARAIARGRASYLEDEAKQKAEIAKLNSALGGQYIGY